MRTIARLAAAAAIATGSLLTLTWPPSPSGAITGGTEDTANTYANVGLVVFYQPDGRFRCSGTLIAPRVVLTAAHCTFQDIGKVAVSFDPVVSRTEAEAERDIPRASDDTGPDQGLTRRGEPGFGGFAESPGPPGLPALDLRVS